MQQYWYILSSLNWYLYDPEPFQPLNPEPFVKELTMQSGIPVCSRIVSEYQYNTCFEADLTQIAM